MKKLLCFAVMLALLPGAFSPALAEAAPSIIATNFPCYDLARQLWGQEADIRMLLSPGSESHSYEPSPQDLIALQNCDLFVYVGGESDAWVETILDSLGDAAPATFRLCDQVTLVEEEHSASMESHEHDHDHEDEEMDEHVWTSPKNMLMIVPALADELSRLFPASADAVQQAEQRYLAELEALDAAFEAVVQNGQRDLIIFGDRFPFRYFARDYGLRYDAAFPGCSEDGEPSVRTVISLVNTIRQQQIPVVFYIEFSSRRTADILAEETGAKELLFHSCHNVSAQEIADGATYLSLMWRNVDALKEALD